MTTPDPKPDPFLWSVRRERAIRWLHTDLKGELTLSDEMAAHQPL
jgi:hypothetical protein